MPGTAPPAGANSGLPVIWNGVIQSWQQVKRLGSALNSISAAQASSRLVASGNTGGASTPTLLSHRSGRCHHEPDHHLHLRDGQLPRSR